MIRVKDKYRKTPQITIFDGLAINLVGDDLLKVTPARGLSPRKEVLIKGATQRQLRKLYDEGHPILEEVADNAADNAATKGKKAAGVPKATGTLEATADVADMSELHEEVEGEIEEIE